MPNIFPDIQCYLIELVILYIEQDWGLQKVDMSFGVTSPGLQVHLEFTLIVGKLKSLGIITGWS